MEAEMRSYPPHTHRCVNHSRGCPGEVICHALPERDEDGLHCPFENEDFACEECIEAESCDDCGVFEHLLEPHDDRCSRSPLNRDDSPEAKGIFVEIEEEWGVIPERARGMFSTR